MVKTVLFIESGVMGGGSFESLYQILQELDRERFRPVVVFLNHTRYFDMVRGLGVDTRLVRDLVYTKTVPWFIQKRMEKMIDRVHHFAPCLANAVYGLFHGPLLGRLSRIINEEKVDLIYVNGQINRNLFAAYLARRTGLPCICHLRSTTGDSFNQAKADFANKWITEYVSISSGARKYWEDRGVDPARNRVIHNGLPEFSVNGLDLRKEFGLPETDQVVGCISRINWEKGHPFLLDSFSELLKSRPDTSLMVVGHGPFLDQLKGQAKTLGITDKVVFTGYESRAKEIGASLDLLVQPSSTDSFSRTVLEAMRLGTPVIVTDTGSVTELITHEENGLLVDYLDVSGLCAAMERVLSDAELSGRLSANGLRTIKENFDLRKKVREIENVMADVLAGHPGPGKVGSG